MSKPCVAHTSVPISRPISQSTIVPLPSPPKSASLHSRRPSDTMQWLSRSNTLAPTSKPFRISEPKLARSPDARSGVLGSGATVVRTPDDALRQTGVRLTYDAKASPKRKGSRPPSEKPASILTRTSSQSSTSTHVEPLSPPTSPPLPPLPLTQEEGDEIIIPETEPLDIVKLRPVSNRTTSSAPNSRPPSRSSLKGKTTSIVGDDVPTVPPLPPHIAASTQPPPFAAVLISDPPSAPMHPSKVIVTLETCTATYRTTLQTINSRPSHLSAYITSLSPRRAGPSNVSSVYSTQSDDVAMYRNHLTSQGLLPQSTSIHLFLDRLSSPYLHILSYLRSPVIVGQPELLPRALQFHRDPSYNTVTRIEALIELRDEAAFLGLEGLSKLCADEIRIRYGPKMHTRGNSSSSAHLLNPEASLYSLHTLLERGEAEFRNSISTPSNSDPVSAKGKPALIPPDATRPPLSPAWDGRLESTTRRNQSNSSLSTPPAGWI